MVWCVGSDIIYCTVCEWGIAYIYINLKTVDRSRDASLLTSIQTLTQIQPINIQLIVTCSTLFTAFRVWVIKCYVKVISICYSQ